MCNGKGFMFSGMGASAGAKGSWDLTFGFRGSSGGWRMDCKCKG